jgi:ubiquinone/menaquinone biosynthesis C-methylase UbiE
VVDAAAVGIDVDVLDLATGDGAAAILASRRGATVIGLDPGPGAVERAVEMGVPVDWMDGTVADIPCPPESMDVVISARGLDGIDLATAAAEVMRVIRAGGRFVLAGWGDEAAVRAAFEPYGVDLRFDGPLACGRRARPAD